jgi:hypothetical protein
MRCRRFDSGPRHYDPVAWNCSRLG